MGNMSTFVMIRWASDLCRRLQLHEPSPQLSSSQLSSLSSSPPQLAPAPMINTTDILCLGWGGSDMDLTQTVNQNDIVIYRQIFSVHLLLH